MTLTLSEFIQKSLKDIDHDFFTYFDMKKGQDGSFSTYPKDWCDHYIQSKYFEEDYVFRKNLFLPTIWGEKYSQNLSDIQKLILKEAQDFQIYQGITIPFFLSNAQDFITIAFNKMEKFSDNQMQKLSNELQIISQMIFTYKYSLDTQAENQVPTCKLIEEVATWQKNLNRHNKKKHRIIEEILSDIRSSQMFISHHETKELGLETLSRAYKELERLL